LIENVVGIGAEKNVMKGVVLFREQRPVQHDGV
jgi:hypothetical protein